MVRTQRATARCTDGVPWVTSRTAPADRLLPRSGCSFAAGYAERTAPATLDLQEP